MARLMQQRSGDPGSDHPFARHPDDGDGIVPAARQTRSRPADRRTDTAIQVAQQRRNLIGRAGQRQRIMRQHVQPRQPHPEIMLASLGQRVREKIELGQQALEPQPQDSEPPLRLDIGCGATVRPGQPVPELSQNALQFAAACLEIALDGAARGNAWAGRRDHRHVERKRLHLLKPRHECARIVQQQTEGRLRNHGIKRRSE